MVCQNCGFESCTGLQPLYTGDRFIYYIYFYSKPQNSQSIVVKGPKK